MPAQTPTTIGSRRIIGDLVFRDYVLANVANGDTLVVPQDRIEMVMFLPTIATATPTCTISNGPGDASATLTFVSQATWSGQVSVISRLG
jgi:hypothetical protein